MQRKDTPETLPLNAAAAPDGSLAAPKKKFNVKTLVLFALFTALIAVFGALVGTIMIGPVGITIMHIPVVIGAILLGWQYGALLGFIMGLVSFLIATFLPFVGAFAFSPFIALPGSDKGNALALVVCFVPRILIGVFAGLFYKLLHRFGKSESLAWGFSALVGSLTNTVLVLTAITLFFKGEWAAISGIAQSAVVGAMLVTVFTNGIPEATVAFLVALGVGSAHAAVERRNEKRISAATQPLAERNNELLSQNESLRSDAEALKAENERLKDLAETRSADESAEATEQPGEPQ